MIQFVSYIEEGKLTVGKRSKDKFNGSVDLGIFHVKYEVFDVVGEMVAELRKYVKDGIIPRDVESFGELHEYIDANMLAEYTVEEINDFFTSGEIPTDREYNEFIDALNLIQNEADRLIKCGILK